MSRPSSRIVERVNRSPTCRPMSAKAVWLEQVGHGEVAGRAAQHRDPGEDHRAEQHAGRDLGPHRDQRPDRGERDRQRPVERVSEEAGRRHRARPARVLGAEEDRDPERGQEHDDQDPQVLHERDEPVVGAELAGHARRSPTLRRRSSRARPSAGRAAVVRESTAPPIRQRPSVAAETSSTGSQEPARARSASACRYAPSVTPATACAARKTPSSTVTVPGPRERDRQADQQRREQVRGRQADQVQEQAAGDDRRPDRQPDPGASHRALCPRRRAQTQPHVCRP